MTVATIERTENHGVAIPGELNLEPHQRAMLEAIGCADAPDPELRMFFDYAQRTGLNPFERQIYLIGRNGKESYRDNNGRWHERWVKRWTIQTGIDGFRSVAESSDQFAGQTPVEWCDSNGKWFDAWPHDHPPIAARVGVERHGHKRPTYATAHYREYCPKKNDKPTGLWKTMPAGQLAKCAEALALRKAFPKRLSGMYVAEEMDQADGTRVYNITPEQNSQRESTYSAHAERVEEPTPSVLDQYRSKIAESITKANGDVDSLAKLRAWASDPSRYDEQSIQQIEVAIHEARAAAPTVDQSSDNSGAGAEQPEVSDVRTTVDDLDYVAAVNEITASEDFDALFEGARHNGRDHLLALYEATRGRFGDDNAKTKRVLKAGKSLTDQQAA